MATISPITSNVVSIEQDNNGQIAVGNLVYQIGTVNGGVVNFITPEQIPAVQPRQTPVMIRPRRMAGMLDRKVEVETVTGELAAGTPVEFYGSDGAGKTALLRALAYHPVSNAFPDGVIYLLGREQPIEDLLQSLYDAFYETSTPYKPSEAQIRIALSGKKALILLDDVAIEGSQVQALMDAAPDCTFVMTSQERRLWGEGSAYALPGLPEEDAETLFQRELGRFLNSAERTAAKQICSLLLGHPLRVLQAGSVSSKGIPIEKLAGFLAAGDPPVQLNKALLGELDKEEKRSVVMMAALGAPISSSALSRLGGLPGSGQSLETMVQRGLVEKQGESYSLTGPFEQAVHQSVEMNTVRENLLPRFGQILEQAGEEEASSLVEPAIRLMRWAASQGRWENVLQIAKKLDPLLSLGRRWGAWKQVLGMALDAAGALGNPHERAWALHQLGTRAECLEDNAVARDLLIKALRLRHMLGDREGEAVTRHNLDLLLGPGPGQDRDDGSDGPMNNGGSGGRASLWRKIPVKVGLMATSSLAIVVAMLLATGPLPYAQPPTPAQIKHDTVTTAPQSGVQLLPSSATPVATITETITPSPSVTPPPTITPSPTPSSTPTRIPTICAGPPYGWVRYMVKQGDTLSGLALATKTSVYQIQQANCMTGVDIYWGRRLWLPFTPAPSPVPTTASPSPVPEPEPGPTELPDLVVSVKTSLNQSDAGFTVPLYIWVTNQGKTAAKGPIDVSVDYEVRVTVMTHRVNPITGSSSYSLPDLAPGQSMPVQASSIQVDSIGSASISVKITVDSRGNVLESNEANNIAIVQELIQGPMPTTEVPTTVSPTVEVQVIGTQRPAETIAPTEAPTLAPSDIQTQAPTNPPTADPTGTSIPEVNLLPLETPTITSPTPAIGYLVLPPLWMLPIDTPTPQVIR